MNKETLEALNRFKERQKDRKRMHLNDAVSQFVTDEEQADKYTENWGKV